MYIYKAIVVFLFFCAGILNAQNPFQEYENEIYHINELEDVHEKEYQLSQVSTNFTRFLQHFNKTPHIADTAYIHFTKSSDSKYEVYYYNTYQDGILYRLDWYVMFGEIGNRKVLHFFDKNFSEHDKRGIGTFTLHMGRREVGDVVLYPLTFSFKADKKIYRQYKDIASVCMFEELMMLPTAEERLKLNEKIIANLEVLWKDNEYFLDKFKGLTRISTLISDDGKVKLCTWNVPLPNSENVFFGAVMIKNEQGNITVEKLEDASSKIRSPERALLTAKKWFGATYYDIVSVKDKRYGTYYILLGYKPKDEMTKMKVMDPMIVVNDKNVNFGNSVFQNDRVLNKRMVFEYSINSNMMLRYERENKRFVLDHLGPSDPIFEGNYRMYGPDFSYDSYELQKGKWVLEKDVLVKDINIKEPSEDELKFKNSKEEDIKRRKKFQGVEVMP